ncbi:hypothetical protein HN011_005714 [Eciton burchellii]|nr:hypothetical protein HN011_005714 [Eciton burchellii]
MSMRKLHINITLDKIQDTVHKKMKKEKKGELTTHKNNGDENLHRSAEWNTKTSATSTGSKMDTRWIRRRVKRMDDNRLAKIARNEKSNDIGSPGQSPKRRCESWRSTSQAHWIKYRTWSHKKMKKKKTWNQPDWRWSRAKGSTRSAR